MLPLVNARVDFTSRALTLSRISVSTSALIAQREASPDARARAELSGPR